MEYLYLFFLIFFFILIFLYVFNLFFDLINFFRGLAPNLSSKKISIDNILLIYSFLPGQKVADFGAGYGNVLSSLQNLPIKLTGYEINPLLSLFLKIRFFKSNNVKIIYRNFFRARLEDYDVVIIYGSKTIMSKLEEKIVNENVKNIVVISNKFKFFNINIDKKLGNIYLYKL